MVFEPDEEDWREMNLVDDDEDEEDEDEDEDEDDF